MSLEDLPAEIIYNIVEKIEVFAHKLSFISTCKYYYAIRDSAHFWKKYISVRWTHGHIPSSMEKYSRIRIKMFTFNQDTFNDNNIALKQCIYTLIDTYLHKTINTIVSKTLAGPKFKIYPIRDILIDYTSSVILIDQSLNKNGIDPNMTISNFYNKYGDNIIVGIPSKIRHNTEIKIRRV